MIIFILCVQTYKIYLYPEYGEIESSKSKAKSITTETSDRKEKKDVQKSWVKTAVLEQLTGG